MTTYYVDATGGNDGNNGQSEGAAFKTIAKVNDLTGLNDDTIYFKRGEHWHECLRLVQQVNGGNNLVIDAYGTGADPIISGGVHLTSWSRPDAGNSPHLWRHTGVTTRAQVLCFNEGTSPSYKLSETSDVTEGGNDQGDFYCDEANDWITMWSDGDPAVVYTTIEAVGCIASGTGYGPYLQNMSGASIKNIRFEKWGVNGLSLANMTNCIVDGLTFAQVGGCFDMYSTRDGQALMTYENCAGTVIRECVFYDVYNVAITLQASSAATCNDLKVYHNRVYNCYRALEIWGKTGTPSFSNTIVAHNVFYNSGGGDYPKQGSTSRTILIAVPNANSANNVFYNNILHTTTTSHVYQVNAGQTGYLFDYNCYYPDTGTKFRIGSTNYNFTDWKTAISGDAHSITSDPSFVNAATYDFHLSSADSPCYETGVAVTGITHAVDGPYPDIGMYEFPHSGVLKLCPFRKAV